MGWPARLGGPVFVSPPDQFLPSPDTVRRRVPVRTLQRRLRSHRLQRIEAEMAIAEAREPRAHATGLQGPARSLARIPHQPLA